MPQVTPLVLNDGLVDVTFRPDSLSKTNALFIEESATLPANQLAKVNVDRPETNTAIRRALRINVPTNIGTTEEPKVIWNSAKTEFVFDKNSTEEMRERVKVLHAAQLAQTMSNDVVVKVEWLY